MSLRILYVGMDLVLNRYLQDNLDMRVVRCVGVNEAKLLIEGIDYSAVILDKSNKKLEGFVKGLYKETPVLIVSSSPERMAEKIRRCLQNPK